MIDSKLAGLYLTHYADKNGAQRYAAVTQMEPTDARRMVPCFDEPEFKAVWRLKIIHPVGSSAVSNAKEILENEETYGLIINMGILRQIFGIFC